MEKTIEEKLQVLAQLAALLNENKISWAVGGSLLLYFRGLVSNFHDLDLMIDEHAGQQVSDLFSMLGTRQPLVSSPTYSTHCFMEFTIADVDIDVIGTMVIHCEGQVYELPLREEEIEGQIELSGQRIPLYSLRQWEFYYTLMGRTEKAAMVHRALEMADIHNIEHES